MQIADAPPIRWSRTQIIDVQDLFSRAHYLLTIFNTIPSNEIIFDAVAIPQPYLRLPNHCVLVLTQRAAKKRTQPSQERRTSVPSLGESLTCENQSRGFGVLEVLQRPAGRPRLSAKVYLRGRAAYETHSRPHRHFVVRES